MGDEGVAMRQTDMEPERGSFGEGDESKKGSPVQVPC